MATSIFNSDCRIVLANPVKQSSHGHPWIASYLARTEISGKNSPRGEKLPEIAGKNSPHGKGCRRLSADINKLPFQGAYRIIPFYTQGVALGWDI
ncbi:MAG: hypothetical protein LBS88_10335 [Tannerellaceae bacterium]|nr:hypothetical protein [Tannerellaceae bacterium]